MLLNIFFRAFLDKTQKTTNNLLIVPKNVLRRNQANVYGIINVVKSIKFEWNQGSLNIFYKYKLYFQFTGL